MRVLIIAPRYKSFGLYYELPLGLAYISAYLKSKGVETTLYNLNEVVNDNGLWDHIKRVDVICSGGLSVHYGEMKRLLDKVRRVNPSAKIILGGGLLSSEPELMMSMLHPDIGVIGEGEIALYDAVVNMPSSGSIVKAEPIKNLDALPFPDYEGLGVRAYLERQIAGDEHYLYPFDNPRCLPVISSRSCPHNCSFCFHPLGKVYRQRSLDNYFAEIELLIESYQINMVAVLDELISVFPERINEFCVRIKKYSLKWMTQMRVDSVNQDTINMLKDAGCIQISYGIEHINKEVLNNYNKRITPEQIEKALEMTYNAGIGIQGNMLLGGPKETPESVGQVLAWRNKNLKYHINITPITAYPGTDLYIYGKSCGKIDGRSFIEQGCPFINFNNAPVNFPVEFIYSDKSNFTPATDDPYRGQLFQLEAVCPHCKYENLYKNIFKSGTALSFTQGKAYRIACRNCNQRFDMRLDG